MRNNSGEPTHVPANGNTPSVVNLVFAANIRDMGDMRTETRTSNHVAVIFEVGAAASTVNSKKISDYSKVNWMCFQRLLDGHRSRGISIR